MVEATQSSRWMAVFFFFLQKSGKPSQACGREQFLPKPTCFHEVRRRRSARAETSILEVEALLDHLFRHNNTPVHVAKRLIPRFVTSNPSPSNIDLLWMPSEVERTTAKRILAVTAISVRRLQRFCCTSEARSSGVNAKYSGTLREHMVRVIHLMGHELQERTRRTHRVQTVTGFH